MIYKHLLRPLLFALDPERAHDCVMALARLIPAPLWTAILRPLFAFESPRLEVTAMGLRFRNPVGLAAGFDKNCAAVGLLSALGFGHIEIGTITSRAQAGNPRPRIFRFERDGALINRMGFPSHGVERVAQSLRRAMATRSRAVIGVNIGKSREVPLDGAVEDYLFTFSKVRELGDYFAVNVSSPNTPELRKLQERSRLGALFRALQEKNTSRKPLLVKIAPDLEHSALDEVLACCQEHGVSGIIATNTTLARDGLSVSTAEAGGLSGRPLFRKALELVGYISQRSQGKLCIVGAGGISSADDARAMLDAGASLVQIYTGLIFEGPSLPKRIKEGIARSSGKR